MSDCSPLQLCIHHADDHDRAAVLEVLAEMGLVPERGSSTGEVPTVLQPGQCDGRYETPLGQPGELASQLRRRAPSAVFELWQAPHMGSDGHYIAHVPGTGTCETACDAEGAPHIGVRALADHLSSLPAGTTVREWLSGAGNALLGAAVLTALNRYRGTLTTGTPVTGRAEERAPDSMHEEPMSSRVPWNDYPLLASDDPAKRDLELIHAPCGQRVCDVEHEDTLPLLAGTAADHEVACPLGKAA